MIVTTIIVAVAAMITVIVSAGMIIPTAARPSVTARVVGPVTRRPDVIRAGTGRSCFNNGRRRSDDNGHRQSERKAEVNASVGGHGGSGSRTDESGQEDGFGFHILPFYFVLVCFVFLLLRDLLFLVEGVVPYKKPDEGFKGVLHGVKDCILL